MQTDVLIVGQGLSGTWLSYWLEQAGMSYVVVDDNHPQTASRVCSGVINPVTGRRMSTTWLADVLLPFANNAYASISQYLQLPSPCLSECVILDFFSAPDRRLAFAEKANAGNEYLHWPADEQQWFTVLNYALGFGEINPCYLVDTSTLLESWRKFLLQNDKLVEEQFDARNVVVNEKGIQWRNIHASYLLLATGTEQTNTNWFKLLPFSSNKGEALIIEADALPQTHIYKMGLTLVPWKDGLFWAGSSYGNQFEDAEPTLVFRKQTEQWLRSFLKSDFKIVDHLAAVRPTTVERRPFAGFHPKHSRIGIMNGMGTKGVSLAPWVGWHLAQRIVSGKTLPPEIDVQRFKRILTVSG